MKIFMMNIWNAKSITEEYAKKNFPNRFAKAQKFKFEKGYLQSIATGALLTYAQIPENTIKIDSFGKPYCDNVCFSISHSGEWAVLVVDSEPVGIDIQDFQEKALSVSKRVFTVDEQEWVGNDVSRFTTLWSLKESVMKITGKGLSLPANSFCVLPFLNDESIIVENMTVFAKSKLMDNYAISLCSTKPIDDFEITQI